MDPNENMTVLAAVVLSCLVCCCPDGCCLVCGCLVIAAVFDAGGLFVVVAALSLVATFVVAALSHAVSVATLSDATMNCLLLFRCLRLTRQVQVDWLLLQVVWLLLHTGQLSLQGTSTVNFQA